MRMTIDEATLYMELYKRKLFDSVSDLDKDIEAYNTAIETMRKYQKITEIVTKWHNDLSFKTSMAMTEIEEVIEDGKID